MDRAFSKILVLIIIVVVAGGGFFAWQYLNDWRTEKIDTQNWEEYTDKPLGNNPLGYSVPSWSLLMKLPPNLEGEEGVFSILDKDGKKSGVDLEIGVNLFTEGELKQGYKELILQYKAMASRKEMENAHSQHVTKIKDIAIKDIAFDGCNGPQVLTEGIGATNIVGYETLCVLGNDIGEATVIFSLTAYDQDAELLDRYKPLYDAIISTFNYSQE